MVRNLRTIVRDGLSFFAAVCHRRTALATENLFLRKQLALFRERERKAGPTTPADRLIRGAMGKSPERWATEAFGFLALSLETQASQKRAL
jgi:hypothetical protein